MHYRLQRLHSSHCEASDLYKLPPISLDPLAEQVESNCQVLKDLKSVVEHLESKFFSFSLMSSTTTSRDHSSEQQDGSKCYASMVTSFTPPAATHHILLLQLLLSLFSPLSVVLT